MRRKNLDSLCEAISAGSEIRTIDQLKAEGKKKIAIVTREKVRNIICTIVDEIVTQEVGHLTEQERSKLQRQTQERMDAMLKHSSSQENSVSKLKGELESSNKRMESVIEEARATSGASKETRDAINDLAKQLSVMGASLADLEGKPAALDEQVLDKVLGRIGELEQKPAELSDDSLNRITERLGSLAEEQSNLSADALERVLGRIETLEQQPTVLAEGALDQVLAKLSQVTDEQHKIEAHTLDLLLERLNAAESAPAHLADGALDAVLAKLGEVGEQKSQLDEASMERLMDSIKNHGEGQRAALVSKLEEVERMAQERAEDELESMQHAHSELGQRMLEALGTQGSGVSEQLATQREQLAELSEVQSAIQATLGEELKASQQGLLTGMEQASEQLSSLQASQRQARHAQSAELEALGLQFTDALVRSQSELKQLDLGQRLMQERLGKEFEQQKSQMNEGLEGTQEKLQQGLQRFVESQSSELEELRATLSTLQRGVAGMHSRGQEQQLQLESGTREIVAEVRELDSKLQGAQQKTAKAMQSKLSAQQAATDSQMAELQLELQTMQARLQASQAQTLAGIGELLDSHQAGANEALQEQFEASMSKAVKDITLVMEAATAKPINPDLEGADELLDRMLDGQSSQMTSNMGSIEVESKSTGMNLAQNLGRLRQVKSGKAPKQAPDA